MKCIDFDIYASSYIDDNLSREEKENFQSHINRCEDCRIRYENLKLIIETVNDIPEVDLPQDFHMELRKKLDNKNKNKIKDLISVKWRVMGGLAAALLVLIMSLPMLNKSINLNLNPMNLSDRSSEERSEIQYSSDNSIAESHDGGIDMIEDSQIKMARNFSNNTIPQEETSIKAKDFKQVYSRKIIDRGYINLEVENLDDIHEKVISIVGAYNGYIQGDSVYHQTTDGEDINKSLKSANMELRIPSESFQEIFSKLKELGKIIEENTSGEDITENYMDIDNQKINLELQEDRLREILEKADKVDDLLQIENELNRIRTEINRLTGILTNYDNLVSMSTINLYIVEAENPKTSLISINNKLWSRAKNNFVNSINSLILLFEKLFVGFFGTLPILIVITVIIGPIGYFIYKRLNKN